MKRLLLALALLTGCASSLEPHFAGPVAPGEDVVARSISTPRARSERGVVVGLSTAPVRLVAFDLAARKKLWETPVDALSAPLVAGDAVVLHERGGVTVRDLATGSTRVELGADGKLVAADGIGSLVLVTTGQAEGTERGTVTLVDGKSVRWTRTLTQPVGSAALLGDHALVPWATQRLSVLAASDGAELTRWTFTGTSLGQARVMAGGAYIGQHTLTRVTPDIHQRRLDPLSGYAPLKRPLPAQPAVLRDGYQPVAAPDSAEHRLAVTWQLAEGEGAPRAEHDLLVLRFYRMVFGLSASSDSVRWVQLFDRDIVAAQVSPAGLWLVDDAGKALLLDPSGAVMASMELGVALQAAVVRAVASSAPPAVHSEESAKAALSTLHDQLLAAARSTDDRLVLGRAYAIEKLADSPDAAITAVLIELCGRRADPEPVRQAACSRLAQRDKGDSDVLAALKRRGSFLEGTEPPPVGPLAQAAARMGLTQAGPLLLTHAENPGTPAADLAHLFQALEKLEQRSAVPTLERFLRLHHGEPPSSELQPALSAAVSALAALRARTAKPTLEDVARDELGTKTLRDEAQKALLVIDAPPASKVAEAKAKVAEPAAEAEPEVQIDPRPYALDVDVVRATLKPVHAALERCVTGDPAKPASARVTMIVAGAGTIEGLLVIPTTLQACIEPVLRSIKFPETRLGRQHISHVITAPAAPK
jgi:hypothetical protein